MKRIKLILVIAMLSMVTVGFMPMIQGVNGVANAEGNVAMIVGGDEYPTVQAAITAATSGQTVQMLANSTERMLFNKDNVSSTKAVNLDLNGYALIGPNSSTSGNDNNVIMLNTAKLELTIKDSNSNRAHYYKYSSSSAWKLNDTASEEAKNNAIALDAVNSNTENGTLVLIPGGTITGGNRSNNGGGIYAASNAKLTLNGINIIGNTSTANGGGIYGNKGATINCSACNIVGNTASYGGGIYNNGGTVNITDGTFESNTATGNQNGSAGGFLYSIPSTESNAIVNITGATIRNNQATHGGGICNAYSTGKTSEITIQNCEITGNSASGHGGGIHNMGTQLHIIGGSITSCTATNGGGIANDTNPNAVLIIQGCSITNNTSTNIGGGVCNDRSMTISGATKITGNKNGTGDTATTSNVYLESGKTITVGTDGLDADKAAIGVTLASGAGDVTGTTDAANVKFFTSDDAAYAVTFSSNVVKLVSLGTNKAKIVETGVLYQTVQAAIDEATSGQTVQMLANYKENVEFQSAKTITLDLNGKVLCGDGTNSVIKVAKSGSKLTIKDSNSNVEHNFIPATGTRKAGLWKWDETNGTEVVKGGIITGGKAGNGGGVYINAGTTGELVLEGGSIVGCEATNNGGGVYADCPFTMKGGAIIGCKKNGVILLSNANFTMTGGIISNCNGSGDGGGILTSRKITIAMSGNAKITECEATNGGGLCIGSEKYPNAQFTMSGYASISNCSASASTNDNYGGGGVWIRGTMTLKDNASISKCEASNGGGVLAQSGIFNMEGGSISQCKIVKNGSNAYKGGGVFVSEFLTQFNMTGGIIEKCEASVSGNLNTAGGGVCVKNGGSFIFSGGTISQCNTNNNGGGVYNDGTMKVSGTANISGNKKGTGETAADNNLYLTSGKTITVSSALTKGAAIGVTLGATGGVGEVTGTNSNDYSNYFTADDAALYAYNDANVVKIGVAVAKIVETGKGYSSVQAAIIAAENGQMVRMLTDSTENVTVACDDNITLDLDGHVLKGDGVTPTASDKIHSVITNNGTLTIKDSNTGKQIHYFTYKNDDAWEYIANPSDAQKSGAVAFENIENATLESGTTIIAVKGGCITGGTGSALTGKNGELFGGAVVNDDIKAKYPATLTLSGGTIVGNGKNDADSFRGGAVYNNGTFVMNGGCIAGNRGNAGGGVYNAAKNYGNVDKPGKFTLTSGRISYNIASLSGGGVLNEKAGTFTMKNGTISNNDGGMGGGVSTTATFIMENGSISRNKATSKDSGNGGGVHTGSGAEVTITGGSITGNSIGVKETLCGGGVYLISGASLTVGGTVKITGNTKGTGESAVSNNLYLEKNMTVTVSTIAALVKGVELGITTKIKPTSTTMVDVTGANTTDFSSYFTSDDSTYEIVNESNTVKLGLPHAHSWAYTLSKTNTDDDTVTASCSGAGTCTYAGTDKSLTIIAPSNLLQDGTAKEASFGTATSFLGESLPTISYQYKATSDGSYATTTVLTDAGYYKASFTVGSGAAAKTGYVTYQVASPVATVVETSVKYGAVQAAINAATSGETVKMLADSTENLTVASDDKVTLDLDGHVLKAKNIGSVITVANNGTLTIKDSKHSDATVKHYFTVGSNDVWNWNNDASVTDYYVTGGVITGGNNSSEGATHYGNGVANKGTLGIEDVNIIGNSTGNWGGGLLSEGGSVTVKNSLIAHNYAIWCAAVGIRNNGTYAFENTEISNNESQYEGGGFYIENATATLTKCMVSSNTASKGGGLYLKNGASVTMTGGSVANNSARDSNGAAYLTNESGKSACSLTLNGVSVTGNTAKNSAGGIAVNNGHSLSVSGTTKISGNTYGTTPVTSNVYLASGKTITVGTGSGANVKYLENGAFIGVTTEDVPAAGTRIDITGSNSANYSSYFTSDNTNYKVINTGENTSQILRLRAHEHAWKYEVDSADTTGATLKATCTDTVGTCDSTANESLTIVIPAHETYGDGKSATATFKDSKTSIGGLSTLPAIKYQKKTGESTYEDLNAAPTDAGTYKASITIGTGTDAKTASVEYTIAKAAVTLSNISATEITYGQTLADSTVSGTAKFGDTDVSGTWSWKTAATTKPEISDSENTEYDVSFTPAATETNFKVTDGKVKIKVNKQDYTGDKTATAKIKAKAGSTVEVTLPNIPEGASYGTPTSTNAKVSSSVVTSKKITLTVDTALVKVTDSEFKVTVPVTGANIYKDYNIEVTVTPVYKEVVTINATAENFTYGDTGKIGYTGLSVTGDKLAVEKLVKTYYKKGSTSALAGVPTAAGEYKLVISVAETNEDYEGSKEVEFEIAKKSITVSAENKTSYVGQNLVDLTYTNDELCAGDSFTGALLTAADMNTVGSYAITQGTLKAGDNYFITFNPGTYTVSDKAIQTLTFEDITGGNVSKSYGDSKFTETVTGAQTTVTYSSSEPTVATVNSSTGEVTILKAGSTTITATAAETAEYAEGTAQYTLTVNKKSISVTADNKSSYVGADLVALTYTADALCDGDSFTGELETDADKSKTGKYDITQGTLTAGDNYNISFTKGTYTVGEKRVDPTPVDPTPAIVVPVSGDKKEVKVEAQINGNNAIVKTVTSEEINEVGTGDTVVVNLSNVEIKGKKKEISEATITKDTLKNVEKSDATGLEIRLSTATAVIDKTTLKTLIGESTGNDIHLVVDVDSKAEQTLTKAQKETIGEMNEPKVLDAYFVSNGKRISDFNGGKVKLLVEYPTDKPVRVWFVANEGEKDKINSTFDEKMGIASFEADHFSHYVIETVEEIKDILIASGSAKGKTNTIKWAAVEGADFYEVYFARCGGEYKKIKSLAALKYVKKGLDPKKEYKYKVKAYKKTEDGKVCISTSPTIHIAGSKSKYSNATKVTVDKTELSLKAGETAKISAKVAKKSSKKALLWKRHVSGQIRYISSDKAVATVDSKGNVKAVGEGVAYVYAIATNGLSTKTEVVVESNLGAVWIGG